MADVLANFSTVRNHLKCEQMTSSQASMMLESIPRELFERSLSDNGGTFDEFQDIAIDILRTLLPCCSHDTLENYYFLFPLLLHRLQSSDGMDPLCDISQCILCLYTVNSHDQVRYIHDTADVLSSYCVKNSKDFPFTCIIERLTDCIIALRTSCDAQEIASAGHAWPADVRTLVERALKTRTEMITDDTRLRILRLVREVFEILGEEWFSPNLSLLLLLVHIAVVQVRMCLDKPDNINSQSLAICYHIIEMAIRCVEESSLLDDSMATRLATVVREVAFYSIEYWVEAKQQGEHLDDNVELVLYRFVACLLAVDGAEMLPASLMEQCSSLLLDVFQREIANGNHSVAHLLLPNLHVLPKLSENVILSLVELLISRYADSHWKDTEDGVAFALESLGGRLDFYNAETLANARLKLEQTIPDCELSKLLAKL